MTTSRDCPATNSHGRRYHPQLPPRPSFKRGHVWLLSTKGDIEPLSLHLYSNDLCCYGAFLPSEDEEDQDQEGTMICPNVIRTVRVVTPQEQQQQLEQEMMMQQHQPEQPFNSANPFGQTQKVSQQQAANVTTTYSAEEDAHFTFENPSNKWYSWKN